MKKFTRQLMFIFVAIILLIQTSIFSNAITTPNPIKDTYVYDMDEIIDDEIEKELNSLLLSLNSQTDAEVVVVSLKSLENITIEEYANKLFNTLGIGQKSVDNGVLLIFSKTDNKVRIEIGRGFEGILTDSKCGRILDNYFVPNREKDDYNTATNETTKAIVSIIANDAQVTLQDFDTSEYESTSTISTNAIVLIMLFIIILAVILALVDSNNSDYSSGTGFFGSGGGSSSGGFGGGFSSGGGSTR